MRNLERVVLFGRGRRAPGRGIKHASSTTLTWGGCSTLRNMGKHGPLPLPHQLLPHILVNLHHRYPKDVLRDNLLTRRSPPPTELLVCKPQEGCKNIFPFFHHIGWASQRKSTICGTWAMCSARERAHLYLESKKQPLPPTGLNAAGLITFFPIPPFLMPPPLYVLCITEDRNKEMLQSLLLFFCCTTH